MPRYRKQTAKIKAKNLTKTYIKHGLSQSAVARAQGVTPQAICQRMAKKPVTDILQQYLDSPSLRRKLIRAAEEGLAADDIRLDVTGRKINTGADHNVRHKFWRDCMSACGALKESGKANSVTVLNIIHGYRNDNKPGPVRDQERAGKPG